ncbi:MAG: hypothetical protein ISS57_18655 [Anaerolineales bacterium]|nr:hypothetical protein [Anaerolineales bacterium]
MTKVIIIQGGSLESYYEQTMDYLHAKYHTYPSNLLDLPISPEDASRMGYYEKLAQNIAAEADIDDSVPLGKLVV